MQCIVTYATVGIRSYLKSLQGYKLSNFGPTSSGHYLPAHGSEDSWLLLETKRGARAKYLGNSNTDI